MEQGRKNDNEKPAMALIPPVAEIEMAKAFTYGANKYSKYNWMNGIEITRLISAARRHMNSFMMGEDLDPESGNSHLGHALASIAMALETLNLHPEKDDRPKGYKK